MTKKHFWLLTPLLLLFGLGVLFRSTNARTIRANAACSTDDLSGLVTADFLANVGSEEVIVPTVNLAEAEQNKQVLGVASIDERWIEVDLSEQKLRAWDGDNLFLESLIASGLPHTPTPTGEFRIWIKLRATKMEGGEGSYYYYLPNVPYVMFLESPEVPAWRGYGLHGTYWHNSFGTQRSHGCVNLPTPIAEKLYYWTAPVLPDGKYVVYSDEDNLGTRVIIHE